MQENIGVTLLTRLLTGGSSWKARLEMNELEI